MALSKTLFTRLTALRESCRAFSSSCATRYPPPGSSNSNSTAALAALFQNARSNAAAGARAPSKSAAELASRPIFQQPTSSTSLASSISAADLESAGTRRWQAGDVYAPHDLSFNEMQKWRFDPKKRPKYDVFDVLGLDPLKEYKNFALLGEFVSDMGRIKHRNVTGLRAKNQRRVAKAIRRAVGLGMMPSVHRHPELLERELRRTQAQQYRR